MRLDPHWTIKHEILEKLIVEHGIQKNEIMYYIERLTEFEENSHEFENIYSKFCLYRK